MVAKEHDRDERHDGEGADQRGAFAGDRGELDPEGAAAPRVEREPPFDAVGEVAALPQLGAEIRDRKAAVAGGSMALSIAAYAIFLRQYPFALILGFVLIILIHEIGHAVVIRAKGLRAGVMVFIPFIGGAVTLKDQPRSAYDDAQIGLAGPIFGTVASLVVLQLYKWLGNPLYLAIAAAGVFINLFNLLPIGMLDGGRISA